MNVYRSSILAWLAIGALFVAAPALASSAPSAAALAEPGVVEIETRDEDGDARRTKIWIVSQGDMLYVRTVDSRWNANLVRDARAQIYADGGEAPVTAQPVAEPALRDAVNALFAEKYGFSNTLRNLAMTFADANMWALAIATP